MKVRTKQLLSFWGGLAAVSFGVGYIIHGTQKALEHPTRAEFVCEMDGALSERHVGVKKARYMHSGDWVIHYVDGDGAERIYKQHEGETCAVERVR